ncbi:hypothetical protein [Salinibacillus aidingensis]
MKKLTDHPAALMFAGIAFILLGAEGMVQLFHSTYGFDIFMGIALGVIGLFAGFFLMKRSLSLKNQKEEEQR